jgi:multiple sugar transport system ATP-binding protein
MQLGTPRAIYTDPDNLFVAGFVGSPSMNLVELELVDGAYAAGGAVVDVPGWLGDDAELTVGFRPEHVTLAPSPNAAWSLSAEVHAVEPMGAETFVHLRRDALSFCARVAGFGGPPLGEEVTMSVREALWFDRRSGQRLRKPETGKDAVARAQEEGAP